MGTMPVLPAIMPVSEMRQSPAAVIEKVNTTQEPVFITQHGHPKAVVIDYDSYGELIRKLEMMGMLLRSERDIQEGRLVSYEEVKADINKKFGFEL